MPFCERVCPYCDFAVEPVGTLASGLERDYVDLVLREFDLWWAETDGALAGRELATLYLGGGTPSLLDPASVERILSALRARFEGEPSEATLEMNPGRPEVERATSFRAAGITRASLGVQSLDDRTLQRLGRGHTGADAQRGLDVCLAAGFETLSADLIYAAPGQTLRGLAADVQSLVAQGVPHLSAYALSVEPGTPFAEAERRGQLGAPGEDEAVAMAQSLESMLAAAGLERYEISSYARSGHRSRHNQRYWRRQDVLGLGPSAAGLLGSRRVHNLRDRRAWSDSVVNGELPLADDSRLSQDSAAREGLYLGLRRIQGVDLAAYERRYGAPPERLYGRELTDLLQTGLIEVSEGRLRLSERGLLFADEVFIRLVEPGESG